MKLRICGGRNANSCRKKKHHSNLKIRGYRNWTRNMRLAITAMLAQNTPLRESLNVIFLRSLVSSWRIFDVGMHLRGLEGCRCILLAVTHERLLVSVLWCHDCICSSYSLRVTQKGKEKKGERERKPVAVLVYHRNWIAMDEIVSTKVEQRLRLNCESDSPCWCLNETPCLNLATLLFDSRLLSEVKCRNS
jgi:hypothetical protein